MIQPEGTITYKGNRKSRPGETSLIPSKDEKVVKVAGDFYKTTKKVEKKSIENTEKENKTSFYEEK